MQLLKLWPNFKKNRILLNVHCPISFIPTINKELEVVVANKIFYLAEIYIVFLENHFEAQKSVYINKHVIFLLKKYIIFKKEEKFGF